MEDKIKTESQKTAIQLLQKLEREESIKSKNDKQLIKQSRFYTSDRLNYREGVIFTTLSYKE